MKKNVITINENELRTIIKKLIIEQSVYDQSEKTARENTSKFVKGTKTDIKNTVSAQTKLITQSIITIGKVILTVVFIGGKIMWVIGNKIYNIQQKVHNSIIKILVSTGKVVVNKVTQISTGVKNLLIGLGVIIGKTGELIMDKLNSIKDSSINLVKWVIGQTKQFGNKIFSTVLIGVNKLTDLGNEIKNWTQSKYSEINKNLKQTWNQASREADNVVNGVKNGVSKVAGTVSGGVKGFIDGMLSEMADNMYDMEFTNTKLLMNESYLMTKKHII